MHHTICHVPLRPGGLELTKHALQLCQFYQGNTVLDLGCGFGQSLQLLLDTGLNAYGIEINPTLCNNKIICANAQQLPFKKQSLDGILSECVLSLLADRKTSLAAWHKLCKPSARLIIHDVYAKTQQGSGLHPTKLLQNLKDTGWNLLHCQDYTQYLAPFAAQLLWHGESCDKLQQWKNCGYALWIAQKP